MANKKLQGITITIDGDTTDLSKSLKSVNDTLFTTQKELKAVEQSLKLDPGNLDVWRQKQMLLTEAIDATARKLEQLRTAKEQADADPNTDKNSAAYRELVREIANTEAKYKDLSKQQQDTEKTADDLAKGVKTVGDALDDSGKKSSTFGDMLKANLSSELIMGAIKSVSSAIKGIFESGIQYNAQMESFSAGITAMLDGDAAAADNLLNKMKEIASASSFDTASFVEASQALLSAGVSAEKTEATIKALGDAVAYTGGGNAELSRMAQNLQQIQNVGKATSTDIKQFANAGINIYGILADYLGTTTEEIKDMDITFEDLSNALIQAGEEGGRYFGAMSTQANTFNGQVNKMKSGWAELTGYISKDVTDALKNDFLPTLNDTIQAMSKGFQEKGIDGMIEAMNEGLQTIVQKIVDKLPDLIQAGIKITIALAKGIINAIPDLVKQLPKVIKAVAEGLLELVSDIFDVGVDLVKGLWNGIKSVKDWIVSKIKSFGNSILDGLKAFFGIHSPSTLMRDEIGENIALGIAEGIEDGVPDALADVDAAMSQLNAGVQASINPVINTNANTTPLIINIQNFNNNSDTDIQALAEKLEYYRRNAALSIGGEF
jgi:tape measure domain-containing protein